MEKRLEASRGVASWALAAVLAAGLVPTAPALAEDDLQAGDAQLEAQAVIPAKYDLRDDGVVTPVKQQSPWGSCWAFGGIAAAETSILSDTGTTYDATNLDLSEKHLAWYALHPVTKEEDAAQAGEGIYVVADDTSEYGQAAYDNGGFPIYVTSLFSSGTSPQLEEDYPYRGVAGLTELQYMQENESAWKEEQFKKEYESVKKGEMTEEQLRAAIDRSYTETIADRTEYDYYSNHDDWSIPALGDDGYSNRLRSIGYLLKDGNMLPPTARYETVQNGDSQTKVWVDVDWDGVRAMKQEILNGHAATALFCADTSQPSQVGESKSAYINLDNWAHYTYADKDATHAVCIVGWDDDYPASNFAHAIEGMAAEDAAVLSTPAGNGAWIAKNSWGSETDADESEGLNGGKWGVKDADGKSTGYFYISYYDKSLNGCETMSFGEDMGSQAFISMQYDYLPAQDGYYTLSNSQELSSANVFSAEEDMKVVSVSTQMPEANMRVTFRVYKLNDNAANPEDGELVASLSRNFEFQGYHRVTLDQPFQVAKGERFSVVATASTIGDNGARTYGVSVAQAVSESAARGGASSDYGKAVVNQGESFLKSNGEWVDWADMLNDPANAGNLPDMNKVVLDNFSIKAFGIPAQDESSEGAQQMHRLYNPYSGEHFFTASEEERDALVEAGWTYEGEAWNAPDAGAEVHRLYNANGGEHHYTMDAAEKDLLVTLGWDYEGVGWHSAGTAGEPLYRLYNPNAFANNHHYTTSQAERDDLVTLGWKAEGIGWYGA